jgi:hypothetical protein
MTCRNCVNGGCTKRCVVYEVGLSGSYNVGSMYESSVKYGDRA